MTSRLDDAVFVIQRHNQMAEHAYGPASFASYTSNAPASSGAEALASGSIKHFARSFGILTPREPATARPLRPYTYGGF